MVSVGYAASTHKSRFVRALILLVVVCLVGIAALGFWKTLHTNLIPDEGIFAEAARLIVDEQGLPYRDIFDHKPPVIFFWLSLFIAVFGKTTLAVKAAALVAGCWFSLAAGLLAFRLSASRFVGGFAFLVALAYSGIVGYQLGSETTFLMITFGTTAMLLAVWAQGRGLIALGAGILFSLGFFAKQPLATDLPVLLLFGIYFAPPHRRLTTVISLLAGVLLGTGIIVLWAGWNGILDDFWYQAFYTNFTYVGVAGTERPSLIDVELFKQYFIGETLIFLLPISMLALFSTLVLVRDVKQSRRLYLIMLVWMFTSLAGSSIGRAWTFDYFLQLLVPFIVMGALGLPRLLPKVWFPVLVVGGLGLMLWTGYDFLIPENVLAIPSATIDDAVAEITVRVEPDECILTWGNLSRISYFSGRRSCINFAHEGFLMVREAFDIDRNRIDYMQQLFETNPTLLVKQSPWGYFPMLDMYFARYAAGQVFNVHGIRGIALDTSSWHNLQANYADKFALLGVDLFTETACPGELARVALTWRVLKPVTQPYMLFIQIVSEDWQKFAEYNGLPNHQRPTETWMNTGEIILGDTITLPLPADMPPGNYQIISGFFDLDTHNLPIVEHEGQPPSTWIKIADIEILHDCES